MPYSVTRYETHDADEQAEKLESWDQSYEQLSAGPFAGSLVEVTFDSVRLFREKTTQSVHQHGSPGQGAPSFFCRARVVRRSALARFGGRHRRYD